MEFNEAAKDCDKALELQPDYLKVFQKKAIFHVMLKERICNLSKRKLSKDK